MFFVVLLVGLSSALPSPMMSSEPGVPLPEYRVLSQKLNETGIEMCEDMLHLCPATADCCKKEDGKWDCCPKQAAIGVLQSYAFTSWGVTDRFNSRKCKAFIAKKSTLRYGGNQLASTPKKFFLHNK
ncbi:hypothetical protein CEXT_439051 [Caerostris extrusa]|uniref:Uncharacterized protein n=1 Tax=Caerostris extrusa TaxID=172846 RepID=A0AAV4NYY7_CAEEX|nr:hypothetical protein CEXT_439051 [Caerostris extrusa]